MQSRQCNSAMLEIAWTNSAINNLGNDDSENKWLEPHREYDMSSPVDTSLRQDKDANDSLSEGLSQANYPPRELDTELTAALHRAEKLCAKRQVKWTQLRQQIFVLIWQHRRPLGAYVLMDLLKEQSERNHVAPPTVYRTLDFLLEQGLIYKIHCLNAFIACLHPDVSKCEALFICKSCGHTDQVPSNTIQQAINLSASQHRFAVSSQMIEVTGVCAECRM